MAVEATFVPPGEAARRATRFARVQQKIRDWTAKLQRYVDRLWYPPLLGLLAALDNLVIVIPNDGLLISSSMLMPRRWFALASCVSIGSTIGAVALAAIVETQGLAWILGLYPGIDQTTTWTWTQGIFESYGLIVVFLVALAPIAQQPAVVLAGLANTPLHHLAATIFAGRFAKFLVMAYLGSHAPRLLNRLWGVKGELDEIGVKVDP